MNPPVSHKPQKVASRDAAASRDAYEHLAATHYENFPVGSILVPKALRAHVHRIYAFARTADDIADELRDAALLAAYRESFLAHVERRVEANGRSPLFADLATTIAELDLPVSLFLDLLDAFEQDLHVRRYANATELYDYCKRSADPVGRLVLRVFGHRDDRLDGWSDSICSALQLLNHLQDLREDLVDRDRIYFPSGDLARLDVAEDDLRAPRATPAVRQLVREWAARTAAGFLVGWPLVESVTGRLRLELRAILGGAAAVLERLERSGFDPLEGRVHLSKPRALSAFVQSVVSRRRPTVFARLAGAGGVS